jgi:PKD repeat protein
MIGTSGSPPPPSPPLRRSRPTATRRGAVFAVLLVAVAVAGGLGLFWMAPLPLAPAPPASAAHLRPSTASATPIQHVVFVWFENHELGQVLRQNAPFEHYLASKYALSGQFYSVRHDSEPDYLAATSGVDPDAFRTGGYPYTNVGDLVDKAGLTWGAYFEGMPSPCYNQYDWTTGYEVTHDPFVQYTDVWHNWTYCTHHVLPMTDWNSTLASGSVPNYIWLEPSIFHDQHSGTLGAGSSWLESVLNPILNASWFASTVIFVTYDEGLSTDDSGFNSSYGGNVYTVAVSPYARSGYNSSHPYQTYSLLTTTEWLLGLGSTGQNDSWSAYPPMKDLFTFGSSPPGSEPYTVSGTVTNSSNGQPIGGAHVVVADSSYARGADTGTYGFYSIYVPAGAHSFYVTDNNYNVVPATIVNVTKSLTVNFQLTPAPIDLYPITGSVTDASTHATLVGAQVLINGGGLTKETTTDANGTYWWPLLNGTYVVQAVEPGYVTGSRTVTISGHGLYGVNFALARNGTAGGNLSASINADLLSGAAPLSVNFTSTVAGGAPPYRYLWNFSDGTPPSSAADPNHIFHHAGGFVVTLTVQDTTGATVTASLNVSVRSPLNTQPLGVVARLVDQTCNGSAALVQLTGYAHGGTYPYNYSWSFGDGTNAAVGSRNVTHAYTKPGSYTATLTASDAANETATGNVSVSTVGCGPGQGGPTVHWPPWLTQLFSGYRLYLVIGAILVVVGIAVAALASRRRTTVVTNPP